MCVYVLDDQNSIQVWPISWAQLARMLIRVVALTTAAPTEGVNCRFLSARVNKLRKQAKPGFNFQKAVSEF